MYLTGYSRKNRQEYDNQDNGKYHCQTVQQHGLEHKLRDQLTFMPIPMFCARRLP